MKLIEQHNLVRRFDENNERKEKLKSQNLCTEANFGRHTSDPCGECTFTLTRSNSNGNADWINRSNVLLRNENSQATCCIDVVSRESNVPTSHIIMRNNNE